MHYQNKRSQQRTTPFTPRSKRCLQKSQKCNYTSTDAKNASWPLFTKETYQVRLNRCISSSKTSWAFCFCDAVTDQNKAPLVCVCMEELRLGGCSLACYDTTQYPAPFGSAVVWLEGSNVNHHRGLWETCDSNIVVGFLILPSDSNLLN